MSNTLFIGDLHGDYQLYQGIKRKFPEHNLILVGDYVDSFFFSREDQLNLLTEIFADVEQGRVQALVGNHELSYMHPVKCPCSGYTGDFFVNLVTAGLHAKLFTHLQSFIALNSGNILVTHAGLSRRLLDDHKATFPPDFDAEVTKLPHGMFYNISKKRGGSNRVGGIFWCDWRWDFEAIPGIIQIFGHTPVVGIQQNGQSYNIDCLQTEVKQVLELANGNFNILSI